MKVINSWDSPEDPTMNSRCADCNCEDCRCDRSPMPAAGPWRTDVENCPLKQEVLMRRPDGMHYVAVWNAPPVFDRERHPNAPIAFATINRPETTS